MLREYMCNVLPDIAKKSQHACVFTFEAPRCVSVEPEHGWFITMLIPQPGVLIPSCQHAARSPRHEPTQLGGVCLCVRESRGCVSQKHYAITARVNQRSGVRGPECLSLSERARRKSMGEGTPSETWMASGERQTTAQRMKGKIKQHDEAGKTSKRGREWEEGGREGKRWREAG